MLAVGLKDSPQGGPRMDTPSAPESRRPDPAPRSERPGTAPAAPARLRHLRHLAVFVLLLVDVSAITLATIAAVSVRQATLGQAEDLAAAVRDSSLFIGPGWVVTIAAFGGYSTRLIAAGPQMYRVILRACAVAAGVVGVGMYITGIELSRAFFVALFVIGTFVLVLGRLALRKILGLLHQRGHFRVGVIAVGPLSHINHVARIFARESWLGYELIGAVTPRGSMSPASDSTIPRLGYEDQLAEILRREDPSVVLFTAGATGTAEEFRSMAWALEDSNIDVIVAPAMTEIASSRVELRPVAGLPLVHMERPRGQDSLRWEKRVFDVLAASGGLLVLGPLMLIIALVIRLYDGGPVLFTQQRVGRDGKMFRFLKFRSMVTDAEQRLAVIREQGVQDSGNQVMFKMRHDPRITAPGRFLRRFSLDELPQLINVLRGDMSLVGPRPALLHETIAYDDVARRRLSVRPGITGLWQVSGRSDLSWEETVRLDVYYVDNWSLMQDLQIVLRTVRAVLLPSGAY